MNNVSQLDFISKYIDNNREHFNEELFRRDENEIIDELKKVILSCQRDKSYIIRVESFEVVDDYGEIYRILQQYEEINNNRNKSKKKLNRFGFIDLKDSDIKLLIIKYYLNGKDIKTKKTNVEDRLTEIIAIPRYVDKYYFRISGNYYSAMWQVVDGSTYNNLTSHNSTNPKITLKKYMPPIQIYKNETVLEDWKIPQVTSIKYTSYIFNSSFPCLLYIFAKYGFYNTLNFMSVDNIITVNQSPIDREDMYNFKARNYYVSIPKMIFDKNEMCQNIVASIVHYLPKAKKYYLIFLDEFWKLCLGGEYLKIGTVEKGESILDSLESIYDKELEETIILPYEEKKNVYCILRWIMREFDSLQQRSNLDIGYKYISMSKYIASIYNMKICNTLYSRISGKKNVTIKDLKDVVNIDPLYLLQNITKSNLINYRDLVNDLDAITALAYTTKRIASVKPAGKMVKEKQGGKENQIPKPYRYIHPSQMGRIDIDSSHKSDPGTSGNLCPMTKLYNRHFSKYKEPNEWQSQFDKLIDNYRTARGMRVLFKLKDEFGNGNLDNSTDLELKDNIKEMEKMIPLFVSSKSESKEIYTMTIPLEKGGTILYSE